LFLNEIVEIFTENDNFSHYFEDNGPQNNASGVFLLSHFIDFVSTSHTHTHSIMMYFNFQFRTDEHHIAGYKSEPCYQHHHRHRDHHGWLGDSFDMQNRDKMHLILNDVLIKKQFFFLSLSLALFCSFLVDICIITFCCCCCCCCW
jgi:hypothetical protein